MEVTESREYIIDYLIALMIELAWKTKLGNRLIETGELNLTIKNINKTKAKIEKFLQIIHTTDNAIIPMGALSNEITNKENKDYYFILLSIDNLSVAISDLSLEFVNKRIISESHARNSILYWFRDWQINPEIIKNDLEKISKKIKKRG